ncbi:MAG: hypothetical protein R2867_28150 [Caldilineaceae bacterium]
MTASDGVTGLALVRQEKPELLVLDLHVARPRRLGDPRASCAVTDPDPALAGLYIIMLTARVEEQDRVAGLELGAG